MLLKTLPPKTTATDNLCWAEGFLTAHKPIADLEKMVAAFRNNGGKNKPVYLQVQLAYGADEEALREDVLQQWRTNVFPANVKSERYKVEQFDALGESVSIADITNKMLVSSSIQRHIDNIRQYADPGFERIILHNVARNQREFITIFGEKVLPKLQ